MARPVAGMRVSREARRLCACAAGVGWTTGDVPGRAGPDRAGGSGSGSGRMEPPSGHRALYKGRAAPWKEAYRQRCVARLKNSRAKLLERYRHMGNDPDCNLREPFLVQEVMEEEWIALKALDTRLPSLWKEGEFDRGAEYTGKYK
ncbi:RPA-interacting protein [Pristis pectinata]|uniref:RPA-interacting protein n=1 Tax=Pristis pectinata TaxID=685728 RepID=UPI00223E3B7A|nr:RPA-interacting protein [Pristis pectinata]XP_051891118.1 RPA-interacting protein [Pristis pectinata]